MSQCPTLEQLQQLFVSDADPSDRAAVEMHMEVCDRCQRLLDRLTDLPQMERWRRLAQEPPQHDEPAPAGGSASGDLPKLEESWPPHNGFETSSAAVEFPGPATAQGLLGRLGNYHIQRELGQGAYGVVFQAYDGELHRPVAIKILKPDRAVDPHARLRFEREAQLAVAVSHEHVVTIHHVGRMADDVPFLVMEYVEGESLKERLKREGALPADVAARIVRGVALGLGRVHAVGLVHRDIKPSNILLEKTTGRAKLTDFGLARILTDTLAERMTQSGGIFGTPEYMSPEQITDPKNAAESSDLFSVGVVLYELLCGVIPFHGDPLRVALRIRHDEPPVPRVHERRIPRDLETICMKCLRKEPQRRYANALALAADLECFLDGKPIQARPVRRRERLSKWVRREPMAALLAAGMGCLTLALLIGGWVFAYREGQRADREGKLLQQTRDERDKGEAALLRQGIRATSQMIRQHRYSEAGLQWSLIPASRRGWEYERLRFECQLAPHPVASLGAHEWGITDVLAGIDGRTVITAGQDGRLLCWDLDSSQSLELQGGMWSPRRCWRHALYRAADEPPLSVPLDCPLKLCCVGDGDCFASASLHGKAQLSDLRTGKTTTIFSHDRPLFAVASSADGQHLLFGDDQGVVRYQTRDGSVSRSRQLSHSPLLDAVYCAPHGWIVGQGDGTVSLLDLDLGVVLHHEKRDGPIWDLALDAASTTLAVACNTLDVFRVERGGLRQQEMYTVPENETPGARAFHAVNFSADGGTLYAADDAGFFMAWRRPERSPRFVQFDQLISRLPPAEIANLPLPMQRRVTAIVPHPDQRTVMTAGQATTLRRWAVVERKGVTSLKLGPEPRVVFDPIRSRLLYSGDAEGTVAIWHSHNGSSLFSLAQAHRGAVRGVATSKDGTVFATGGADGGLRFWSTADCELRPIYAVIQHDSGLRSIALSPDGRRAASYDEADHVFLWETTSGRLLGRFAMRELDKGPTVGGLVAFNVDGTLLAVSGPGASFCFFPGNSLSIAPQHPYMMSGGGGTAMSWHPRDPNRLVGADVTGRVCAYPRKDPSPIYTPRVLQQPVVGLSFAPDGGRFAVLYRDGSILMHDPELVGFIYQFRTEHVDPTSILFDPTGRRLAVAHRDGRISIWESGGVPLVSSGQSGTWTVETVLIGTRARFLQSRAPAMQLDSQDRIHIVATRRESSALPGEVKALHVWQDGTAYREEDIASLGTIENEGTVGSVVRSLGLNVAADDWFAVLRQPRTDQASNVGQLALHTRNRRGEWQAERLNVPANEGFDTSLLLRSENRPSVLHFSHSGNYLRTTIWNGNGWHTTTVGRQGDGFKNHCVLDKDGRAHVLFFPWRFGDDRHPPVYLQLAGNDWHEDIREAVGSHWMGDASLVLDPNGKPIASFHHIDENGASVVDIVRRDAGGWRSLGVVSGPQVGNSTLSCDSMGRVRLSYMDQDCRCLFLATYAAGEWHSEVVWVDPERDGYGDPVAAQYCMATRIDSRGRPVIILCCTRGDDSWLRVFRQRF